MVANVYAERRQRVLDQMEPGVLVLAAARETLRNADTAYPFRQNSDFQWLTGFDEPDSWAALVKEADGRGRFILFVRPKDAAREMWDGIRQGVDGAKQNLGADDAFEIKELDEQVPRLIANRDSLYWGFGSEGPDRRVVRWLSHTRRLGRLGYEAPAAIRDPRVILHELRLHKTPDEVDILRRAGAITREAHKECMRACKADLNERQLVAVLDFVYRKHGSDRDGYNHIVAGGNNACVLHYVQNNQPLRDGDLCLIDSGCELDYYSADITSTFPVNGRFTEPQKRVYNIVLKAQLASIAVCKPGTPMEDVHFASRNELIKGMLELGVITGSLDEIVAKETEMTEKNRAEGIMKAFKPEDLPYKKYFPHGTGHWLGMDVHDVGSYRNRDGARALAPGMVLTVEPGLYFPTDDDSVPAEFRGIGVRIEDDVLITDGGHEILTAGTPRTVEEVEAVMAESSSLPL